MELHYDQYAARKYSASSAPQRGDVITFTKIGSLAEATSQLAETTDIDGVAMSDSQVSITLYEYGNAVTITKKLEVTAFTQVEANAMTEVGNNAGKSIDTIAGAVFTAGTNVVYGNGVANRSSLVASSKLTATDVRKVVAYLENANVPKFNGYYMCILHPYAIYDLKAETGAGAWRTPLEYADPGKIYAGEYGEFEGVRFIRTSHAPYIANSASASPTTLDIHKSIFFGQQAFGKGVGVELKVGESGPFDKLQRFPHIFWYALCGYGIIRQESVYRVEHVSGLNLAS